MTPYDDLAAARGATARLLEHLDGLSAAQLAAPSLLPSWSRAHVVAHLAGNAWSHVRMLDGCLAGEVRAQHADEHARAAGIRELAAAPDAVVAAHAEAAAALEDRWAAMTPEHWERAVRWLDRGTAPARHTVPSREKEVEVHRVDLDAGYGPDDWPPAFARRLLTRLLDRSDLPAMVLDAAPGCGDHASVRGPEDRHIVRVTVAGRESGGRVSYTGEVTVGGPADVRTDGQLQVTKVATPPLENNCYLLRCVATGDTLLVDAAGDAPTLLELVGDGRLVGILETHGHWDHVQALAEVKQASGAPVLAHAGDAADLPVPADRLVDDGDTVEVGHCRLGVIALKGHTPGSIALLYDGDEHPHLFSGDSLFPGGHGRTTTPEEHTSLMDDLERKVFGVLPDQTWVYPGHGLDTSLGAERPHLAEWRERGW